MVKDIIVDEEKLSVVSDEYDVRKEGKQVREVVLDLKDTIREHNLVSLSAIQIGVDKRLFVINFNGTLKSFINPMITNVKGFDLHREVSPCIPGKEFIVPRYNRVEAVYQTPLGEVKTTEIVGVAAMVFQQQVDQLQGILISDLGLEVDSDFDNATEDEKAEIIKMYLDSLDVRQQQLEEEIESSDDLKVLKNSLDFQEKLVKGEITLIEGEKKCQE